MFWLWHRKKALIVLCLFCEKKEMMAKRDGEEGGQFEVIAISPAYQSLHEMVKTHGNGGSKVEWSLKEWKVRFDDVSW